ncbi:hypothetical protein KEM48_005884 [Puccinia striiformis f. sp. tritici PST-130]|nr:hypothetical protein KEM48_005884 [Puccinia striiformis f. sp. tritici PST-130]
MQFKLVSFFSLMATLGSFVAADWKCPEGKDAYCGHREEDVCALELFEAYQVAGKCDWAVPDHKCCKSDELAFDEIFVPCGEFKNSALALSNDIL